MIDADELRRLCAQQPPLTQEEIGHYFGVTGSPICAAIKRLGIIKTKADFHNSNRVYNLPPCPYPDARLIPLTRRAFAIVDIADYDYLNQWRWSFTGQYAATHHGEATVLMHRLILGIAGKIHSDHINGNGLDNRRCNLRIATQAENNRNKGKCPGTNPYKGVSWEKYAKRWRAYISIEHRQIWLGYFDSPEEAAKAYNAVAPKYHGEFCRLNELP